MGKEKPNLNSRALETLINYPWRGNVRELKNVVQRMLFIENPEIDEKSVLRALGLFSIENQFSDEFETFFTNNELPLSQMEKTIREKYFIHIRKNSTSDTEAAKKLGLAPSNYYRMAKELGLK
jgi:DNA-binding NtrC family response regulator